MKRFLYLFISFFFGAQFGAQSQAQHETKVSQAINTLSHYSSERWWPLQDPPIGVVRTDFKLFEESTSSDGRKADVSLGADHMLAASIAGLLAQAVNEKRGDEMLWIALNNVDYQRWYKSTQQRLGFEERGEFTPWQLLERYRGQGIFRGYILYDYDFSQGQVTGFREESDESVNVATSLSGLLRGVLISSQQEKRAQSLGLDCLIDVRGKTESWLFANYRDQLNRQAILTQDPQMPHNRAIAIAHKMMVIYGLDAPTPAVYDWLQAPASILGWNGPDEGGAIEQLSRRGHILLPSNWGINLPLLSAGSQSTPARPFRTFDPTQIDWTGAQDAVSFIMSDGDNVQWLLGDFCSNKYYWSSPDHGKFPIGWGLPIGCLDQVSPATYDYLRSTQPEHTTLNLHAGGYFFPDIFGLNLGTEKRKELLRQHARRVSYYISRAGTHTYMFLAQDLDSPGALEAYEIFAQEIEGLTGMFAIQYAPYEGGEGQVFWVKNRHGIEIPVVTSKYSIWANLAQERSGTPARIASLIHQDREETHRNQEPFFAWGMTHTWSGFKKIEGNDPMAENAEYQQAGTDSAVGPTGWCIERLDNDIHVVEPDELLWRIRMAHDSKSTRQEIRNYSKCSSSEEDADVLFADDFENGISREQTNGWILYSPSLQTHKIQGDCVKGEFSLEITSTSEDAILIRDFAVKPGFTHTASVWAKLSAQASQVRVYVMWFDAQNQFLATSPIGERTQKEKWIQLRRWLDVPKDAVTGKLHLVSAGGGPLQLDDLKLRVTPMPDKPQAQLTHLKPGQTLFPQSPAPAESITVLDLRKVPIRPDKYANVNSADIFKDEAFLDNGLRLALFSLQGLVNRTQPRLYIKMYGHYDEDRWVNWLLEKQYIKNIEQTEDSIAVLRRFKDDAKGIVVVDRQMRATENIATMIAATEDLIITTPQYLDQIQQATGLEVKCDLRGQFTDNVQAYRWAWINLWPKLNHTAIAVVAPTINHETSRDYIIAHKLFCAWITGNADADSAGARPNEEYDLFTEIFTQMPANIPMLGFWDSYGRGITEYGGVKFGSYFGKYMAVHDHCGNLSLHSGVPVAAEVFRQRRPAAPAHTLDPQKIYLAFTVQESGDAPAYWAYRQYEVWDDPARGRVPINWCVGPLTVDLMPDVLSYFYEKATPNDYFFTALSGIGYMNPYTGYGQAYANAQQVMDGFIEQTASYMQRLDLDFASLYTGAWTRYDRETMDTLLERYADLIPGLKGFAPSMGRAEGHTADNANYFVRPDLPIFHCLTRWDSTKPHSTSVSEQTIPWLIDDIKKHAPTTRPGFMQCMALSWHYYPTHIEHVAKGLGPDYVFVTLDELARLYMDFRTDTSPSVPTVQ